LRAKAEQFAADLRAAYPVFLAGRLFGPNTAVRRWIGDLERRLHAALGRPDAGAKFKAVLAVGAALWTGLTLKLNLFQHPKLTRTPYRLPSKRWSAFDLWEKFHSEFSLPELSIQVELQHSRKQVWIRLEGALSAIDAEGLGQRLRDSLARSKSRLVLDLKKLQWDKTPDLRPLVEKLAAYRSRIRLSLPTMPASHPVWLMLASMFHLYKG
jgi:hypothetical protein